MEDKIIAYKGMDSNMQCRGMQYEVGKEFSVDGKIECCGNGLHACERPLDVLGYYPPGTGARYFRVEQSGDMARERGGDNVRVKGGLGAILVIAEEQPTDYNIAHWKAVEVDGETVKADTWYRLVDGKLVEAGDNE